MDTTAQSGCRKGRPNYPIDFKLRLAQQACEPGVSVSRLAREHGINANMLFKSNGDGTTAPAYSPTCRHHRCCCQ